MLMFPVVLRPVNTTYTQCKTGMACARGGSPTLCIPAEKFKSRSFESRMDPSQLPDLLGGPRPGSCCHTAPYSKSRVPDRTQHTQHHTPTKSMLEVHPYTKCYPTAHLTKPPPNNHIPRYLPSRDNNLSNSIQTSICPSKQRRCKWEVNSRIHVAGQEQTLF